jgi:hypothetical protein
MLEIFLFVHHEKQNEQNQDKKQRNLFGGCCKMTAEYGRCCLYTRMNIGFLNRLKPP